MLLALFAATAAATAAAVQTLDPIGPLKSSAISGGQTTIIAKRAAPVPSPEAAIELVSLEGPALAEQAPVHVRPPVRPADMPPPMALGAPPPSPEDVSGAAQDGTGGEGGLADLGTDNDYGSENPDTPDAGDTAVLDSWTSETKTENAAVAPAPKVAALHEPRLPWQIPAASATKRPQALDERLAQISPAANTRLAEKFKSASVRFPPAEIGLVAIKDEKVLELHARNEGGDWIFVHRYPVLAASGSSGPKLRQGDKQVPEGVYGISFLNPNSRYHVSLRVNYPNAFDREMASKEGRTNLGGDIMIHGKNVSIGCLAIGDEAAEELFVLAERTGLAKIKLVIAPTDLRRKNAPDPEEGKPKWLPRLYAEVASAMSDFKVPPSSGLLSFFGSL